MPALSLSAVEQAPRPLRVLLIAPSPAICADLERYLLLSPNAELISWTDSENRALHLFFALRPDVCVLDWRVSLAEPARFVALLKRMAPDARIVCIVPSEDSAPARAARRLNADGAVTCASLPKWLAAQGSGLQSGAS